MTQKSKPDTRKLATYVALVITGMLAGSGAVAFLLSPLGLKSLSFILAGVAGLGLGAVLFAVVSRIWLARLSDRWNTERATRFFDDVLVTSRNPTTLPEILERNRNEIAELAQMGLGFFVAVRSLAYVGMALGAVVSVATLLTAFTQIERLERQNRLIDIQNSLAEANRRASLNFELSNILNALDTKEGADKLLVARVSALTRSLRPYRLLENDGTLSEPLSPERAQLLLSMLASGVDIGAITEAGATFASADFRGANLSDNSLFGADLSNSDLRNANLVATGLNFVNLSSSKLPSAEDFQPYEFDHLNLNGATTTDPYWLANVLSGFGHGLSTFEWEEGRNSEISYILLVDRAPEANERQISRFYINDLMLAFVTSWRQSDGLLIEDYRTENLKTWLEDTQVEIRAESSVTPGEIVANRLPQLEDIINQVNDFRISERTQLIGITELSDTFEFLAPFGQFPVKANFKGISPGGEGQAIVVLPPDVSSAEAEPNLVSADFSYADLRYVDFGSSNLSGANFTGALLPAFENVHNANLTSAIFEGAILQIAWPAGAIDAQKYYVKEECKTFYDPVIGYQGEGPCVEVVWSTEQ